MADAATAPLQESAAAKGHDHEDSHSHGITESPSADDARLAMIRASARAGIPAFPLNRKRPYEDGGFKTATTDLAQIEAWAERYPGCNWGMPTGSASGFDVLDIDGEAGLRSLDAYRAMYGPLPDTAWQITGSGGIHYLFKARGARNSAKAMMPGWDTRGDGGYIVIGPSIHPETGKPYRWQISPLEMEAAEWPAELWALYEKAQSERKDKLEPGAPIPLGTQENELMRMAGGMRRQAMTYDEILAALIRVSEDRCEPPVALPDLKRMARSAASYDFADPMIAHPIDDIGTGHRFALFARDRIIHRPDLNLNMVYDARTGLWTVDEGGVRTQRIAQEFVRHLQILVASLEPKTKEEIDRKDELLDYARRRGSGRAMREMIEQAKPMLVRPDVRFDDRPWLLAVANGVVDLRTKELLPHSPDRYLSRSSPHAYDPASPARDDQLERVLRDATGDDSEYIDYIWQFTGYTACGRPTEEKMPILLGPGGSSKSTIVEAIAAALGTYAVTMDVESLLANPNGPSGSRPREDILRLEGARMVRTSEPESKRRLRNGLVKLLLGGEKIVARGMFAKTSREFDPAFVIWWTANDFPEFDGADTGMRRRIVRLPLLHVVPEEQRDRGLKAHLRGPAGPAVLAAIIEGAYRYLQAGRLIEPARIRMATEELLNEADVVGQFLAEETVLDAEAWVPWKDLWARFDAWQRQTEGATIEEADLQRRLRTRGFPPSSRRHGPEGKKTRGRAGLRLVEDTATEAVKVSRAETMIGGQQ